MHVVIVASLALVTCFLWKSPGASAVVTHYGHEDPSKNLLANWDFERDMDGWTEEKARVSHVSGGFTGRKAVKVDGRSHRDGGAVTYIDGAKLKRNTNYYFSVHFKQLTDSKDKQDPFVRVRLLVMFLAGRSTTVVELGRLPFQKVDGFWKQLGGDFKTPNQGITQFKFYIRIDTVSVSYMLDTTALTEIPRMGNWKADLEAKIKKNRMSDVTVSVSLPKGTSLAQTKVKVELISHEFCFGMAIRAILMLKKGSVFDNYRKFVTDNFNCLGFENALKWRQMEPAKGFYKTNYVTQVMDDMKPYNKTWRGHTVLWGIQKNNPAWIQRLSGSQLKSALFERANHVGKLMKGLLKEWDVINEYEHSHWYEEKTGDPNILENMMKTMKKIDPTVQLFVNDYEVVRNGRKTSAVATRCKTLIQKKAPCDGIGIQSHLRTLPMDVEVLAKRLEIVVSLGKAVTVTEFSVHSKNEQTRAQGLEQAFMVYYSEPLVAGIYGWGFSDVAGFSFTNDMYLTKGTSMTPNAAGRVMIDLIKNRWHTSETFTPKSLQTTNTFSGHHGTYRVTVTTGGQTVYENQFRASKQGSNMWRVQLKSAAVPILPKPTQNQPPPPPPPPPTPPPKPTTTTTTTRQPPQIRPGPACN